MPSLRITYLNTAPLSIPFLPAIPLLDNAPHSPFSMSNASSLTQTVSPVNSTSVTVYGDWQPTTQNGSHGIVHQSGPGSVSFTFNGTHAGAFGLVVSRGILLEVLLTDRCGMILQNLTSSAVSDQSRPSWLCVTHALPCAEYALNLSVGASQSAYISYFGFEPCLPSTDGLNPCHFLAQTPSPTPSDVTTPRSVPISAQPKVRIIFALVFSSLIFGCIVVLLVRRRKRSSAGSGSRFRPPGNDVEHTSSAQVTHLDGGGENDAKSPVSTEMFKLKPPSAAAMPESTPGAEGQSHGPTVGTPQCCFDASIGKPTQCPSGVRIADPEFGVEGQFVRSFLPDTNEPTVLAKYEKEYNSELSTLSTNALWGQSCGASAAGRSR